MIVNGTLYDAACTLKASRKKLRKWSKISMKKYHQRPMLGVRSGSSTLWEA